MIAQKSIQEIMDAARIEDVVGDFVALRRTGANMKGLCPFHHEKTPSFTVTPSKNIFMCFGCGKGGDAITFVREHESLGYAEALRYLAKKYGIQVVETEDSAGQAQERQLHESLFIVNDYALGYYQNKLFGTDYGKSVGLAYFKQRGFREDTVRKFGLGFAPDARNEFTATATKKGHSLELLQKAGLTSPHEHDFFRGRVMFPIHNASGKVAAFAGRILLKDAKAPKYINSPETEVYNKSKTLYGLHLAKRDMRKLDECVIVEGYTDCISLHQAGIENVVASSGTALTTGQLHLIRRYTPNVKFIFDGDQAGIKASLRGLDIVLEQDMNVKIVPLPQGEDPDSYLQKVGGAAFAEYAKTNAKDFVLFKTELLLEEAQGDPIKKAALVRDIVESISKIPDPIKRAVFVRECATMMQMDEQVLVVEMNKIVLKNIQKHQKEGTAEDGPALELPMKGAKETEKRSARNSGEWQEKDLARIMVEHGHRVIDEEDGTTVAHHILANIHELLPVFDHPVYAKIMEACFENIEEKGNSPTPDFYIQHSDQGIRETALQLLATPFVYSEGWEKRWDFPLQHQKMPDENFLNDMAQAVNRRKLRHVARLCEENQQRLKGPQNETEDGMAETMHLLQVQMKLVALRNELAALLKTVIIR
jgi:DNA primase